MVLTGAYELSYVFICFSYLIAGLIFIKNSSLLCLRVSGILRIPCSALLSSTKSFINWRAFSFTFFVITLISLLWEVTLAIPYGWWNYKSNQMMGLFINAWWKLPVEAVCVWFMVTFTTLTNEYSKHYEP